MSKIFAGSVTSHVISHADHGSKLYSAGRNKYLALGAGVGSDNQKNFIETATNVRTIILGQSHENLFQSFIIKNNNSVWAVGRNERGQCGYPASNASASYYTQLSPTPLYANSISVHFQYSGLGPNNSNLLKDYCTFTSISSGEGESVGLIKSWGYNGYGLIGDNTITNKDVPTSPTATGFQEETVVKVAPGWSNGDEFPSNYILTSDGSVYSTGTATNTSVRGLNQSQLPTTEERTYQKLIFNMKSGETVVDISTGTRSANYAALYLLTNFGNILVVGSAVANGQPEGCDNYMPRYVYRNGQFVSYISTA